MGIMGIRWGGQVSDMTTYFSSRFARSWSFRNTILYRLKYRLCRVSYQIDTQLRQHAIHLNDRIVRRFLFRVKAIVRLSPVRRSIIGQEFLGLFKIIEQDVSVQL
jgi:hypothetical protein